MTFFCQPRGHLGIGRGTLPPTLPVRPWPQSSTCHSLWGYGCSWGYISHTHTHTHTRTHTFIYLFIYLFTYFYFIFCLFIYLCYMCVGYFYPRGTSISRNSSSGFVFLRNGWAAVSPPRPWDARCRLRLRGRGRGGGGVTTFAVARLGNMKAKRKLCILGFSSKPAVCSGWC